MTTAKDESESRRQVDDEAVKTLMVGTPDHGLPQANVRTMGELLDSLPFGDVKLPAPRSEPLPGPPGLPTVHLPR